MFTASFHSHSTFYIIFLIFILINKTFSIIKTFIYSKWTFMRLFSFFYSYEPASFFRTFSPIFFAQSFCIYYFSLAFLPSFNENSTNNISFAHRLHSDNVKLENINIWNEMKRGHKKANRKAFLAIGSQLRPFHSELNKHRKRLQSSNFGSCKLYFYFSTVGTARVRKSVSNSNAFINWMIMLFGNGKQSSNANKKQTFFTLPSFSFLSDLMASFMMCIHKKIFPHFFIPFSFFYVDEEFLYLTQKRPWWRHNWAWSRFLILCVRKNLQILRKWKMHIFEEWIFFILQYSVFSISICDEYIQFCNFRAEISNK